MDGAAPGAAACPLPARCLRPGARTRGCFAPSWQSRGGEGRTRLIREFLLLGLPKRLAPCERPAARYRAAAGKQHGRVRLFAAGLLRAGWLQQGGSGRSKWPSGRLGKVLTKFEAFTRPFVVSLATCGAAQGREAERDDATAVTALGLGAGGCYS